MTHSSDIAAYISETCLTLSKSDTTSLSQVAAKLIAAKENNAIVFTAGNGGSSSTASHMTNDLIKGCRVHGREGIRSVCLTDSSSVLTCLANDFSYEASLEILLRTMCHKDDMLICFSGSGNSANVVRAAEYARSAGLLVVGFLGRDGGKLKDLCHISVLAPSGCMEIIEDMHLVYEHALVTVIRARLEDSWGIEVIEPLLAMSERGFNSVLFDFDGTISLIRQGWQDVMVRYFVEVLNETSLTPSQEELKETVRAFIDNLTGKQTIFQCMALASEIEKLGGTALEPIIYKNEYLRRLHEVIGSRINRLETGSILCSDYLVPGVQEFLELLVAKGYKLYLASGTDEADVMREARLLGIDCYFEGRIYGARDEIATECSKEIVIRKLINGNLNEKTKLLAFGDGYVEISLVKACSGYPIGVASDEVRRRGIDNWKRDRLIAAGASAIIPDFSSPLKLLSFLEGE